MSFHSIEDKIVKYFFSNFSKNKSSRQRYFPEEVNDNSILFENYNNKALKPSQKEININNPSRSAKLRFAIRNKKIFLSKSFIQKFKKYLDIEAIYV